MGENMREDDALQNEDLDWLSKRDNKAALLASNPLNQTGLEN